MKPTSARPGSHRAGTQATFLRCCSRGWALRTRVTPGLSCGYRHSGSRGYFFGLAASDLRLGAIGPRLLLHKVASERVDGAYHLAQRPLERFVVAQDDCQSAMKLWRERTHDDAALRARSSQSQARNNTAAEPGAHHFFDRLNAP